MAVPKKKTSPSRRGMRRSADALKRPTYVEDKDSGELRRPHHIDLKTGMYKGRSVLQAEDRGLGPLARPGGGSAMYLIGFPLLVIPFAIYNMIAFLTPSLTWTASVTTIHLISGQDWTVTPEDIILAFAILLLGVEVIKATRMGVRGLMDHILSMILFIVMLVEFLLVARAGTSTFFILMVISLVDVLAGFIITARTAQRDIQIDRTIDPAV